MSVSENEISFFPERWTFEDFFKFSRAMLAGQLETAYGLAAKIVDEEVFKNLNAETGARLLNRISVRLGKDAELVQKPDPETNKAPSDAVRVDLSKWSLPQIYEFEKVNRAGNIPELEKMMHIVASLPNVPKDEPLSYMDGLLIKTAIMAKHSRIMSGKN